MPSEQDLFGFDELSKAFHKIESKYPSKADALLMAQGRIATNKTKKRTPVGKTKKLRPSWRLLKVKEYGRTKVVRIQSTARHAHLVEDGHEIYTTGGIKTGKVGRYNTIQRAARGIQHKGRVKGKKMLDTTIREMQSSFTKSAEKLLQELTSEVEL